MIFLSILILAFTINVYAGRTLNPTTSGYDSIRKKAMDFGFDNLLLFHYSSHAGENSEMSVVYMAGVTFRLFLIRNFSLGFNVNYLYQRNEEWIDGADDRRTSDHGPIGFVVLDYFVKLGFSTFLRPEIAVGGFYGWRSSPTGTPSTAHAAHR